MSDVSVRAVSKEFDRLRALDNVSVDFPSGGFYALLGPSGCGKTTLLRLIAGFVAPTSGSISIAGEIVDAVPVEKRNVGMMFQSYALFPNLNVYDNVGFGPSVRGIARPEIRRRVGEVLELVQLSGLENRRPHELSGGQRQRVALARAIVVQPKVLLLDEPLSALDKSLRVGMQVELKRIQRETGITTIFVTHDQEEALTLSDRVGIMRAGKLIQEGVPNEIYERPNSEFAARFLGDANMFRGTSNGRVIEVGDAVGIKTSMPVPKPGIAAGIAVRPEKMLVRENSGSFDPGMNMVEARVIQHIFAGASLTYILDWRGKEIKVFAQNTGGSAIREGTDVLVTWSPEHAIVVDL
ncbi:MAG: ABC transporter ATP-binding protein [Albidovulum sp.]|nr:ABC transporter ATP-binding protein [Albidovulum sp.]